MATTTNYSWTTPDDTDLVKDGAAAIRTLGSSADTTVKALNPGTTAGDLDYYTTSTAKARLGIGTAGQVLQVNSGATAPEWVTPVASGSITLLTTTNLTGISTTVSSINQTYTDLIIMVRGYTFSGGNTRVVLQTGGVDFDVAMQFDTTNDSDRLQFANSDNAGSSTNIAVVIIKDYTNTVYRKAVSVFGRSHNRFIGGGATQGTGAFSAITVKTYNGTSTFSTGQVLIYGVK